MARLFVILLLACAPSVLRSEDQEPSAGAAPIPVLILNGQNNHDFAATTASLRATLLAAGRFSVDVSTSPPPRSDKSSWDAWRPAFAAAKTVVVDYNGESWPEPVREAFLDHIWQGGGAVLVHAANNAFPGWREWERIAGLLWRGSAEGARVVFDPGTRRYRRAAAGTGPGAGHGRRHPFAIEVRAPDHPAMRGFPAVFMHGRDELYHGQRGPAAAMEVLATAWSDPAAGGTGEHEPVAWAVPYGAGRVFTTVLGHQWRGQEDFDALHCVAFQALFARACEWTATGAATLPLPARMPGHEDPLVLAPGEVPWGAR